MPAGLKAAVGNLGFNVYSVSGYGADLFFHSQHDKRIE
jgi:hypothetical protein